MLPHGDYVAASVANDENTMAYFRGLQLSSAFQPIISLSHRRVVGYEALLRASNAVGAAVAPVDVFALPKDARESIDLDRRCRALHLRYFRDAAIPDAWLFLNVSAQVVLEGRRYGAFFNQLLQTLQFPARRVVVEILEGAVHDEAQLAVAAEYYRAIGCLVALDDFGAGHSNFERIWRLKPDIVKLDLSLIHAAAVDARAADDDKHGFGAARGRQPGPDRGRGDAGAGVGGDGDRRGFRAGLLFRPAGARAHGLCRV